MPSRGLPYSDVTATASFTTGIWQSWHVCLVAYSLCCHSWKGICSGNFATFSPFGPSADVYSVWQLPQRPASRIWSPLVGKYVAVEECITVWCPLSMSKGPYSGRSSFWIGFAMTTFPTKVASVPSPVFSIWWQTEQVTPSAAARSPLGNFCSGSREKTCVCFPESRSAIRTAGIWQIEHSSSIACFDSGWSIDSRRTRPCQYGSRDEVGRVLARRWTPMETSSPELVVSPL